MFHLFTHAFFKALLFLGAGAVIHALHHEQDIWKMGGLSKHMPKTTVTFAIGTLALTGFPLLAGFWSKDSILAAASEKSTPLYIIGLCVAVLTAFYMTRLFVVAFLGKPRTEAAHHGHDCAARMTTPLLILAVLSVIAGFVPEHWFFSAHQHFHWNIAIPATIAFAVGTAAAFSLYKGKDKEPIRISAFRNKFYLDEIYGAIVAGTQDVLAYIANAIDGLISGIVRLAGMAAWGTGFVLRLLQFGNVQGYSFVFGLGVVGLIYYVVFR
jgi:NADH-quinone oxidoreductase subunit L